MLETSVPTSQRSRQRAETVTTQLIARTGRFSWKAPIVPTVAPTSAQPIDLKPLQATDPLSNAAAPDPLAGERQLMDIFSLDSAVASGITEASHRIGVFQEKGAIRPEASASASAMLGFLFGGGLAPSRTLVSADGELSLVFFGCEILPGGSHSRLATLTFDGGETVLSLEDRVAKSFNATIIEETATARSEAVRKISEFVS